MTVAAVRAALYILTIVVFSRKGQDVRQIFVNFHKELTNQKGVTFIQVVKVDGENKIIAAVNVTDVCKLEAIMERLQSLADIESTSEPVITYDDFGAQIGVTDKLIFSGRPLRKVHFFSQSFVDYYGNTTAEYTAVLKESVERTIRLGNNGTVIRQIYKHVAERKISSFVYLPDAAEYDTVVRNGVLDQRLGSNVHRRAKGVQRLDDYVACRNSSRNY
ncbi:hypothetical protein BsWGS_10321 [Bradybaena similaris]